MEGGRAEADQRRGQQDAREAADHRQQQNADHGAEHADRQQERLGMAVGIEADPGLQQRRGQLEGQGDQPDLSEAQAVVGLEHRVDGRQHGLDQVVDQVHQRHGADDAQHHGLRLWSRGERRPGKGFAEAGGGGHDRHRNGRQRSLAPGSGTAAILRRVPNPVVTPLLWPAFGTTVLPMAGSRERATGGMFPRRVGFSPPDCTWALACIGG